MPTESHAGTVALRTALRELVALSTIPAAWVGREPPIIAAGLADGVVWSLRRALAPTFPARLTSCCFPWRPTTAAAAFQNARLRNELDAKVAELRQARNELEMKVAQRTADLRRSEAYLAEGQRLNH